MGEPDRSPFFCGKNMIEVLLVLIIVVGIGVATSSVFVFLEVKKNTESLLRVHKRIDSLFTMDAPSPNEATKKGPDLVDLDEQNIYNLPHDVKTDIEGGDTQVPPEFEKKAP